MNLAIVDLSTNYAITFADQLLAIPSPSFNTIPFWPRPLTLYGLCIAIGIVTAALMSRPRLKERGLDPDLMADLLVWVVPAGVIGGRIYHLITDQVEPSRWLQIWKGGLGIPGAIALGTVAAYIFSRHHKIDWRLIFDSIIPGVIMAQAIGRWGNWFNQELYGRPTDLPWGLIIDRPIAPYEPGQTFHPTFLYESIWNVAVCFLLIWIDRKKILKPGRLVWAYVALYAIGRLWIETIRIDTANTIAGLRVNIWVMSILLIISTVALTRSLIRDKKKVPSD